VVPVDEYRVGLRAGTEALGLGLWPRDLKAKN